MSVRRHSTQAYNIEVTDRIAQTDKIFIEASDIPGLEAAGVASPELLLGGSITFFANDFDTTTQGIDVVANYSMSLLDNAPDTSFSLAYNYNTTEVDNAGNYTSDFKVRRLEEGMPEHRGTFTVSQDWEDINVLVRANYFGEYFATHADEPDVDSSYGWSEVGDSAITIDVQASYNINDNFTVSAGVNNLFEQEAQKLQEGGAKGVVGAVYYESGPFDYNGGFYYVKGTYTF